MLPQHAEAPASCLTDTGPLVMTRPQTLALMTLIGVVVQMRCVMLLAGFLLSPGGCCCYDNMTAAVINSDMKAPGPVHLCYGRHANYFVCLAVIAEYGKSYTTTWKLPTWLLTILLVPWVAV